MQRFEISKEELEAMPIKAYEGNVVLIDHYSIVDSAAALIIKESIIGVDCESKPSFKKGEHHSVSLIQIATSDHVFLFRINKSGFSSSLIEILENKEIIKAGIDLHHDMVNLQKIKEFSPKSIVDLNALAKEKGFLNTGAKKLSALLLGFRISKRMQTTNWEAAVLNEKQIKYAATDAWISREVYLKLRAMKQSKTP